MSTATSIDVARFLAVPTAFLLSGFSAAHSITVIPALLPQPTKPAVSAFAAVFYHGGATVVPGAAIAGLGYSYLAYASTSPRHRRLNILAAVLAVVALPYTRLVMMPTISRLLDIGQMPEVEAAKVAGEAVALLKRWAALNWARAAFGLGSGLVGLYTWAK